MRAEGAAASRDWPWQFAELADSILLALGPDGRVLYINNKGAETLGLPVSAILGRDWFENFLPERLRADVRSVFRNVCSGTSDAPASHENAVLRSDGSERIVAWRNALARNGVGGLVASLSAGEDVTDRRRAEAALDASETRFRATFEQAAVGMAHVGLDGRFLRLNRKLCEITGYGAAELQAQTFGEITHPDDLDADLAQAMALRRGDIPHYTMEKRYIRKDRSIVWANLTGSLVRDELGRPDYFIAVVEDITRRKEAERLLADAELQRMALAAADAGAWEWDAVTGRQSWTPEVYGIYGCDPSDGPPDFCDWLHRCVHAEDREAVDDLVRRTIAAGGRDFQVEIRALHPTRGTRWISSAGRLICDDQNRPLRIYGLDRDVSERRKMEEALHASSERLRMAMEAGSIGVWDWDIASGEVGWSENFAELLDIDPREMPRTLDEFTALVHPEDRQKVAVALERTLAHDAPYHLEFRMVCPDGRVRWAESRGVLVRDRRGHPVRMIGIDMDITARKADDERQAWLMSELDHRVRGLLALVQSAPRQPLDAPALDNGAEGLRSWPQGMPRIAATDRTHTLAPVVARALEGCRTERITVSGPLVALSPLAAQALGVLLQDLSTSSMESGALSVPTGGVAIEWMTTEDAEPMLHLTWTEHDGPSGVPSNRASFSKRLLRARIVTDFGSKIGLAFDIDGFRARLSMPIARVAAAAPS